MKHLFRGVIAALAAFSIAVLGLSGAANAVVNKSSSIVYTGQGLNSNPDGFGGYDLNTEICDGNLNGVLENGADAEGPYLLWVLTANGATSATITGPWGSAPMVKGSNGSFKYVSTWYDPSTLLPNVVSATYVGKVTNAQLVVSHGCRPFTGHGAWCSPGFWRNSADAAWNLTGYTRSDLFNATVVPSFYDTASGADPTLNTVLTTSGANTFGAASLPYGLNAFNATGAFLTDNIPGFDFSLDLFTQAQATGETDTMCPIDNHGDFKLVS
jgi:hypothetical protein